MLSRLLRSTVMSLRPQDYGLLVGAFLTLAISFFISSAAPSPWNINIPLLLLFAIISVLVAIYYRNLLRHIEGFSNELSKSSLVHYKEIEATVWLSALVKVRQPLPFMRGMAISPDFALLLAKTIYSHKPKVIVELGCGTSTLLSSYILEQLGSGRVISIDHDEKFASICRNQLKEHDLSDRAQIFDCPLKTQAVDADSYQYYDLSRVVIPDQVDMLVVDGPPMWIQKEARYPALPLLISKLSPSAVVMVDDAARPDELSMVERWLQKYQFEKVFFETEKGTAILYRRAILSQKG